MIISKRLTGLVPESRRFVAQNVAFQWVSRCEHLLDLGRLPNARKHFRAFGVNG